MIAEFKTESGEDRELHVPLHVSEISFADYADYRGLELQFFAANKEGVKEGDDPDENAAMRIMTECVASICGPATYDIPFALKDDRMRTLMDMGYQVREGNRLSVLRLYVHLVVLIQSYRPKDIPNVLKLTHGGKKFRVLSAPAGRVLAGKPLTTGETIEVMELQRRAGEQVKAQPRDGGNLEFTMGLTQFAILVRQQGEQLPSDPADMRKFIEERRELFATMSLDKILAARYFFLHALARLGSGETSSTSGRVARVPRLGKNHQSNGYSKKRRRRPNK